MIWHFYIINAIYLDHVESKTPKSGYSLLFTKRFPSEKCLAAARMSQFERGPSQIKIRDLQYTAEEWHIAFQLARNRLFRF